MLPSSEISKAGENEGKQERRKETNKNGDKKTKRIDKAKGGGKVEEGKRNQQFSLENVKVVLPQEWTHQWTPWPCRYLSRTV